VRGEKLPPAFLDGRVFRVPAEIVPLVQMLTVGINSLAAPPIWGTDRVNAHYLLLDAAGEELYSAFYLYIGEPR
jgi:hypothetical protein